tara:strand:- start:224 stop:490 length:267 start_codon:yes stop_codon:yes gene_type:complete
MGFKLDFFSLPAMLIPSQTVAMRREASDDIIVAVTIHVEGVHLGRAPGRKGDGMKLPDRVSIERGGVFPPAVFFKKVPASVAIHITHT